MGEQWSWLNSVSVADCHFSRALDFSFDLGCDELFVIPLTGMVITLTLGVRVGRLWSRKWLYLPLSLSFKG